jgi:predicted nucleotidyltransferase
MGINMPNMGISAKKSRKRAAAGPNAKPVPEGTSLADALFTVTQQRVLALLFGQPERSYFATELIGLARVGSGAVQRELKRLVESGLVTVTRVGTQKHYQANHASPVFDELRNLVNKTVALHEPIRDALSPFKDRIMFAAIYGSVAKHKDTASSDIDLLVASDDLTLEQLYSALVPAEKELARKINPTLYTSEEFERRKKTGSGFLSRVLAGEHVVLVGKESGP